MDIDRLLPEPGKEIYDLEDMTREVLHQHLMKWLSHHYFSVSELKEIRQLVRELAGQPPEARHEMREGLSDEIRRLHCIDFDQLSPATRREAVRMAFHYTGLDDLIGPTLIGIERWSQVAALVDGICAPPYPLSMETAKAVSNDSFAWTQQVLASQLIDLLDQKFFDICSLNRLDEAFQDLREQRGMPACKAASNPDHVGLRALHCVHFDKMSPQIARELPRAILRSLGLDNSSLAAMLGDSAAAVVDRYERGFAAQTCAAKPPAVQASLQVATIKWWMRLWRR